MVKAQARTQGNPLGYHVVITHSNQHGDSVLTHKVTNMIYHFWIIHVNHVVIYMVTTHGNPHGNTT